MERNITAKEKEQILNLGAFQYKSEMCADVLGWDKTEIKTLLKDKNSEFHKIYNRGFVRAQYVIDLKLFEQAQSGDIKSLDKLQARKRGRK